MATNKTKLTCCNLENTGYRCILIQTMIVSLNLTQWLQCGLSDQHVLIIDNVSEFQETTPHTPLLYLPSSCFL